MQFIEKFTTGLKAFRQKLRLDSHHAIERFGVFVGALFFSGLLVITTSGFSAFMSGRETLGERALWTPEFETSKTELTGEVGGVYTNKLGDRALVMMRFADRAQISYNAADYAAFLLGSDRNLNTNPVATDGVTGSFYVFGSTGYVGVLLEADEPFESQVLNLTMRANAELTFKDQQDEGASTEDTAGDSTFAKHDQWRVFINPGATGATHSTALDAAAFDPALAYYETVLADEEAEVRKELDRKLGEMRTNLAQISSYSNDLATTKVDGLFLRPPQVPAIVDGDAVIGESAAESATGESTLDLKSDTVVPGGFAFNWRVGNVYDGYLGQLVPRGQSFVKYLNDKREETSVTADDGETSEMSVSDMEWILSDGTDLTQDYQNTDGTMRPLITVMNNLSQSYQDYYTNKQQYQSDLLLQLLGLDVDLRDVQANSSVNTDDDFLVALK